MDAISVRLAGAALLAFSGPAADAGPAFEPVAVPRHEYVGGWEHFVGGGLAVWDCDADGLPELLAAGGEAPAVLLRNRSEPGRIAFEDAGADLPAGVAGAYAVDLDGDAVRDVVLLRVGRDVALRGGPDCALGPEIALPHRGEAWSTAFSAAWMPGDARPTLAFGAYVDRADPEGPFGTCDAGTLMRPAPGSWAAEPIAPGFCALSMLFSDWRRRGVPDLRVSNDRHYYVTGGAEQMFEMPALRPLGPADGWEPVSIWGMGIASRDVTGDGRADVALTSMGDQLLQLSTPEGYALAPWEAGIAATAPHVGGDGRPSTGWHAEWGDVDLDGRDDLLISKGNVDQMPGMAMEDPTNLLMQNDDGTFAEAAAEAGIASLHRGRGAALADLDGDGRLDLALVNRRAPLEVWRNVTEGAGGWLSAEPRQPGGNAFAVGAHLEVTAGGRTQVREVTVGGGHAGGQSGPQHFGLGAAGEARVRVIWPDGARSAPVTLPAGWRGTLSRGPDGALVPAP